MGETAQRLTSYRRHWQCWPHHWPHLANLIQWHISRIDSSLKKAKTTLTERLKFNRNPRKLFQILNMCFMEGSVSQLPFSYQLKIPVAHVQGGKKAHLAPAAVKHPFSWRAPRRLRVCSSPFTSFIEGDISPRSHWDGLSAPPSPAASLHFICFYAGVACTHIFLPSCLILSRLRKTTFSPAHHMRAAFTDLHLTAKSGKNRLLGSCMQRYPA